jgi:hypothetical protein
VAALAARAAGKTLPEQSEVWRFFLAACYTLAAMFLRTKRVIDEHRFTCVVLWVNLISSIYYKSPFPMK